MKKLIYGMAVAVVLAFGACSAGSKTEGNAAPDASADFIGTFTNPYDGSTLEIGKVGDTATLTFTNSTRGYLPSGTTFRFLRPNP